MSTHASDEARVIPLRPKAPAQQPSATETPLQRTSLQRTSLQQASVQPSSAPKEPLWRDLVGGALRRERLAQERTLKEVAEAARISMPYLSELERGRKEASSEVLAAAARALGLGLGDLLSLAQDDLTRHARRTQHARSRTDRGHASPTARHDGLCLAA